jgi:hypothetical protein
MNIFEHICRIMTVLAAVPDWPPSPAAKWFRVRDTYGIEVEPGQNDALILAIAVAIDTMAHPAQ